MRDSVRRSLLRSSPTAEGFSAVFRFGAELPVFRGHFPGAPIVPGVFLVEGLRRAAEETRGVVLAIAVVDVAKFMNPVLPDAEVEFDAKIDEREGGLACSATVHSGGAIVAKLRLTLRRVGVA